MPLPEHSGLVHNSVSDSNSCIPNLLESTSSESKGSRVPIAELDGINQSKRLAAYEAVDTHIKPDDKIIGIGSGSTVPYVVERIVAQGAEINNTRQFIPTSFQSRALIVAAKLNLGDVEQFPVIDVDIDGADEVDADLNCIKGGGACHLREKVLAEASKKFIIVADYRKNSTILGTTFKAGVPIEVVPFAYVKVLSKLKEMPGCTNLKLRMGIAKAGPLVTDNGNFIIDAVFDQESYKNPREILRCVKVLTGVVEVGLFCGMVEAAYFGNADGGVTVRHKSGEITIINRNDCTKT